MGLLTVSNTKILKSQQRGYRTWILHLLPGNLSGDEVCVKRSPACSEACLNFAGRGKMKKVQAGRLRKTRLYFDNRDAFMKELRDDIRRAQLTALREDLIPCIRLNGTSDIPWEKVRYEGENVFESFPALQFYDYTKIVGRKTAAHKNYHLTFSRSENNDRDVAKALAQGMNIAVVFDTLPKTYLNRSVISGDQDDLRFLDPANVVVGLSAKGRARRDTSGFVVRIAA